MICLGPVFLYQHCRNYINDRVGLGFIYLLFSLFGASMFSWKPFIFIDANFNADGSLEFISSDLYYKLLDSIRTKVTVKTYNFISRAFADIAAVFGLTLLRLPS